MNVAIISGASSGMGRQFVIQASERYDLDEIWVIAMREDRLLALQNDVKTKIVPLSLDLTLNESYEKLKEMLLNEKPNVKLLVNCSGFGKFGEFEISNLESNTQMFDLNLKSLIPKNSVVAVALSGGGQRLSFALPVNAERIT